MTFGILLAILGEVTPVIGLSIVEKIKGKNHSYFVGATEFLSLIIKATKLTFGSI